MAKCKRNAKAPKWAKVSRRYCTHLAQEGKGEIQSNKMNLVLEVSDCKVNTEVPSIHGGILKKRILVNRKGMWWL